MNTNRAFRSVMFWLCAVAASTALWSGLFTLRYWDDIWTEANYFASSDYRSNLSAMESRVREAARIICLDEPSYSEKERLSAILTSLDAAVTNYRFELRNDSTGEVILSNLGGAVLEDAAVGTQLGSFTEYQGGALQDRDTLYWEKRRVEDTSTAAVDAGIPYAEYTDSGDIVTESESDAVPFAETEDVNVHILRVWTGEEFVSFRADQEPVGWNAYGWWNSGESWHDYSAEQDSRVTMTSYALRCGVSSGLEVDDMFSQGRESYLQWRANIPFAGGLALASSVVFLILLIYLSLAAGHRKGVEGIVLGWPERIPLDVYAMSAFLLLAIVFSLADAITVGLHISIRAYRVAGLIVVTSVATVAALGFWLTFLVRVKAHKVLDSLAIWRLCRWCWRLAWRCGRTVFRAIRDMFGVLAMNIRLGLVFLAYLFMNAYLAAGFFLRHSNGFFLVGLVLFNGGAFCLACLWIEQWRRIRLETGRVLGGDTSVQINTTWMYPDLKQHAEQLNDLGASINRAVDERLKSEHFKAELITNVSHDLKTPLTSIINYVDLLKKTDIQDPRALEYLDVLDRKSQRLKKLTEDLVEASKASTGNVTVNLARMDLVEFTQQAAAEYQDRLAQQRLALITRMADHSVYISADGRHMWRILDNLLGNCVKYALEGTRVYLEVMEWEGKASVSVKNISREQLNLNPGELTERFVRGDESRSTDGSGLGLSIARSLTEVQGGIFRLETDGDLFKATVVFPVTLALNPPDSASEPQPSFES